MSAAPHFDVAVVGAGPAGSAAALVLARHGRRVVIIEKAVPPRYKTCGGGLLSRTRSLLPFDIHSVVEHECFIAELHHHAPDLAFAVRRDRPVVSMVMRDRFDQLLTTAAQDSGAELLAGTTVLEVAARPEAVALKTSTGFVTARFVIAADGAGSVVARRAGLPELRHVIPALEGEITVEAARFEKFRHGARFDFGLTPHGYGWVFPKREHLSIGVLTTRRGSCNLNDEYARYLAHLGLDHPVKEERHGHLIPVRPREKMFDAPRILLAGDAAGLADPVTAEGISAAILSGRLAAQSILEARENAVQRLYLEKLNGTLLPELRVARLLARVLYDFPRVRASLLARHGQQLSELLTRVMMGETSYREAVQRPGNFLRLFGKRRPPPTG